MAGLTTEQLARFREDGYLIIEGVLTEDELADIEEEYREIVDRVSADLAETGKIRPLTGATFSEKYVEALQQLDDMYDLYKHLDICLPLVEDLDMSHTLNAGPEVFRLLTNPRLLDIAESVIGPEIYSNPIQHTRIKPPQRYLPDTVTDSNIAATGWHQDAAVIEVEADGTDMLTVWVAVTDATAENGCLIVERGSHREKLTLHCPGKVFDGEIYIPEAIINDDRVVPLEATAGSVILLNRLTEHGSLDNRSDSIRWSFDLRYQPIGQPTGRSAFPGFVARSQAHPEQVVTDPREWAALWWEARKSIVNGERPLRLHTRWKANARQPLCA